MACEFIVVGLTLVDQGDGWRETGGEIGGCIEALSWTGGDDEGGKEGKFGGAMPLGEHAK